MAKKVKLSGKKKAKVFQTVTIDGKEIKVSAPWYRSLHRKAEKAAKLETLRG